MRTRKLTLNIVRDADPVSPDQEPMDDALFIACRQNRYFNPDYPKNFDPSKFHTFPLYAYIHSGIRLSLKPFSCPWDSGQIGHVYASKDEWLTAESAESSAAGLVETWNNIWEGQCWGWEIVDEAGDVVDSCFGYIGESSYAEADGKQALKAIQQADEAEAAKIDAMFHL